MRRSFLQGRSRSLLALLLYTTTISGLLAQTVRIQEAESKGVVNRPYRITYEISGSDLGGVTVASQPSGGNLELVYDAVSRGENVSIINGKVSRSSQLLFSYTFVPNQKGRATISGFSIKGMDGKIITAPNHQFVVEEDRQPEGRGGGQQIVRRKPSFLYRAIPSQRSVYVGELFSVVYRVYTNTSIVNHSLDQAPDFTDFISKEIELDLAQRQRVEEFNGQTYQVSDYIVSLLEADSAGTKHLPLSRLSISYPSGYHPEDPFLNRVETARISTEPIAISVKPLPESGRPSDFTGAVGRFDISATLGQSDLRTGSATMLRVLIQGEGNLRGVIVPKLDLPLELEAYPPKESTDVRYEQGKAFSTKEITYSLVPHKAGEYTIPSIQVSYFDPSAGVYKTISTAPLRLKAEGETTKDAGVYQSAESNAIGRMDSLEGPGETTLRGASFVLSAFYPLSYLALVALACGVYYLLSRRFEAMADVQGWRASRAEKLARRRLRSALLALRQADEHRAVEELLSALWGYLGDKLHLPTSQLSRDNIGSLLESNGISPELIGEMLSLIDELEFVRFAPSASSADAEGLYKRAESLIVRLEQNKLTIHA